MLGARRRHGRLPRGRLVISDYAPEVRALMALSAVRKLWPMRHGDWWSAKPGDRDAARHSLRGWLRDLRRIRDQYPEVLDSVRK